jgi:glucose-1-phosphate cytidylyltransferase
VKVVILAGGLGTRLAEETEVKPKPMVEIGRRPILWHIMKHYAHYGFKEFYIALGYKGDAIKRYFLDYYTMSGSMSIDLADGKVQMYDRESEDWRIHLVDTGQNTNTGGRIKRLQPWLHDDSFMLTYGDGVCNVDLQSLLRFHRAQGRVATLTAVRPPARFGGYCLMVIWLLNLPKNRRSARAGSTAALWCLSQLSSITWPTTIVI